MARSTWLLLATLIIPVAISIVLYRQPAGFDPVTIPGYPFGESVAVPNKDLRMLAASERVGDGLLPGPEDFAYDAEEGYLYTGCADGWIRRVRIGDGHGKPKVEDWAHVGGRPLGIAFGPDRSLIVAESFRMVMWHPIPLHGTTEIRTAEDPNTKSFYNKHLIAGYNQMVM